MGNVLYNFVQTNLGTLILSSGMGIVIGILRAILNAIKESNKILTAHDNRLTLCENTLDKIPCVKAGFSCSHNDDE